MELNGQQPWAEILPHFRFTLRTQNYRRVYRLFLSISVSVSSINISINEYECACLRSCPLSDDCYPLGRGNGNYSGYMFRIQSAAV